MRELILLTSELERGIAIGHAAAPPRAKMNARRFIRSPRRRGRGARAEWKAERVRCPHVDHEFELCWLLDRKIGGVGALQDLVHMARSTPIEFTKTRSI